MAHILAPTFICNLAGKYGDHRDTCPLNGKCIQHGRPCEYLEVKSANPPKWRPPKVKVPPTPTVVPPGTTATSNIHVGDGSAIRFKGGSS